MMPPKWKSICVFLCSKSICLVSLVQLSVGCISKIKEFAKNSMWLYKYLSLGHFSYGRRNKEAEKKRKLKGVSQPEPRLDSGTSLLSQEKARPAFWYTWALSTPLQVVTYLKGHKGLLSFHAGISCVGVTLITLNTVVLYESSGMW